jgi:hypothetical protein
MAMTQCKECGNAISTKATACPACGVKIVRTSGCAWIALAVFGVPVVVAALYPFLMDPPAPSEEEIRSRLPAAECQRDLQCWGERNQPMAAKPCSDAVVALAKWDHEWTEAFIPSRFGRWSPGRTPDAILYQGDALKLQNGFGAWQRVKYYCEFEPQSGKAVAEITLRE